MSATSFGPALKSYFSSLLNDTAPCAMRDCSVYTQDHFSLVREEGGCLSSTASGAVKLDLVYNENREDNALSAPDWTPGAGYKDISPECYVYSAPPKVSNLLRMQLRANLLFAVTTRIEMFESPAAVNFLVLSMFCVKDANVSVVPLDSYFHPGRNDTWALASAQSRTEATAAGFVQVVFSFAIPNEGTYFFTRFQLKRCGLSEGTPRRIPLASSCQPQPPHHPEKTWAWSSSSHLIDDGLVHPLPPNKPFLQRVRQGMRRGRRRERRKREKRDKKRESETEESPTVNTNISIKKCIL